jgi:hypothetical protein
MGSTLALPSYKMPLFIAIFLSKRLFLRCPPKKSFLF